MMFCLLRRVQKLPDVSMRGGHSACLQERVQAFPFIAVPESPPEISSSRAIPMASADDRERR
jgi:hypothetical protein